jgi:hypothetical protein
MRPRLSITVNGRRRRVLVVAVPEPIPNLELLTLDRAEITKTGLVAHAEDYRNGAYRFREVLRFTTPGTYRTNAICILYQDGTRTTSSLPDHIVVEVPDLKFPGQGPPMKAL